MHARPRKYIRQRLYKTTTTTKQEHKEMQTARPIFLKHNHNVPRLAPSRHHKNKPKQVIMKPPTPPKSILGDLDAFAGSSGIHIVSKGVVLFTLFYTSLNYMFYRRLRQEYEDAQKKNDNDKKKPPNK